MERSEIYQQLTAILADTFLNDTLQAAPDLKASDVPGWDSLQMVNILVAVEQKFGVKVRSREVDALKTMGDLATLLERKLANKP